MSRYTRQQLELLRFENGEEQEKLWKEVYINLDSSGRKVYDGLASNGDHKFTSSKSDHKLPFPKKESPIMHGVYSSKRSDEEEGESEEDYGSLQTPAFLVEGEPNFDSGPPEDGMEYLRRVRWETSQIPRVKVAEADIRYFKEQTEYMPKIPDIAECPSHLLPSLRWENELLSDFSELRKVLSDRLGCGGGSDREGEKGGYLSEAWERREAVLGEIAGMDSIERVMKLEKMVDSLERENTLSRDHFSSLLALCAVIDLPLRPSTSSALRSLLRKCASLRSSLSSHPDPDLLLMLNVLLTISGRFFAQLPPP